MSVYTDSRSRPGAKGTNDTNDRTTFLTEFGGMVLKACDEVMNYDSMRWTKQITQGKADTFPVIGRKRDGQEHEPGELILGGKIDHDEVAISLDKMIVDSVFIAEIDELMLHYSIQEPYANQLGQSLGSITDKRIAIMHILASRGASIHQDAGNLPVPGYYWAADLKTNAAKLEEAHYAASLYARQNDMSGEPWKSMLPHQQVLLLARYTGIEGGPVSTGSANRAQGTVGPLGGIQPNGTNHIPNVNITTGNTKYRGNFSTTVGHISNRMAVGTLERRGLRMNMVDQKDRLGTLIIASMLNGHGTLRNECSIELRTDAISVRIPTKPAGCSDLMPAITPKRSRPPARSEGGR
ncbi:hypothetical protein [Methylobacterium ajmalii]|jgi:hypothetical protein|uniref:hypothetical protein n=1 Tax=Methylobacterium ajmalii TaxID=2738439 RepID=UPI00190DD9A7|nr:hypothetical protein [Methylobacterium ajmalii]MBK3400427.1 hypothetical protein [Methylobacterium ajmalii]MBK3407531.1 hypothetical protein [Methylobacterium ajmalii]MBK3422121.1 hypothetical protein [Methylobacterium ajmalii]MBZ6416916.1 hypothetical protein [Methylobacterium sp.]